MFGWNAIGGAGSGIAISDSSIGSGKSAQVITGGGVEIEDAMEVGGWIGWGVRAGI